MPSTPWCSSPGRQLEHWHTGSMTRRSQVLDAVEPSPTVSLSGDELQRLGLQAGDVVTVHSRRGRVALRTRRDDGTPPGTVYIPFAYAEAAANLLTNPALDPFGKIPEFKYCAVQVSAGACCTRGWVTAEARVAAARAPSTRRRACRPAEACRRAGPPFRARWPGPDRCR